MAQSFSSSYGAGGRWVCRQGLQRDWKETGEHSRQTKCLIKYVNVLMCVYLKCNDVVVQKLLVIMVLCCYRAVRMEMFLATCQICTPWTGSHQSTPFVPRVVWWVSNENIHYRLWFAVCQEVCLPAVTTSLLWWLVQSVWTLLDSYWHQVFTVQVSK